MARDRDDRPNDTDDRGNDRGDDRPERADERPRKRRRRDEDFDDRDAAPPKKSNTTMIVLIVVGVFGLFTMVCGGLAIGLLLPAVQKVREAAARSASQNNMKIIGLAMYNSNDANAGVVHGPLAMDGMGQPNPGMSFRVGLLPYMEQGSLHTSLDMTQPWDSARNAPLDRKSVV